MKCYECYYFSQIDGDESMGYCHRNPPIPVKNVSGISTEIPEVSINWWCGEFLKKTKSGSLYEALKELQEISIQKSELEQKRVVHLCPMMGEAVTACCGRSPFELPDYDSITTKPRLVTCGKDVK